MSTVDIAERPAELLQRLLRFDTTNPPGNERQCVAWVRQLLEEAGCSTHIVARDPDRPTLVARLAGRGAAAPFLMQGHVDVVPAHGAWTHPPFSGDIADGYIWGRGALDMKGGVAMMLAAFLRAARAELPPPGDVILCLLSDEEAGGDLGARFVVDEHPELFEGVRFAIGEFGGFTFDVAGRPFSPIMVSEKQLCVVRVTARGPAGHGSLPVRGGAMARLGRFLRELDRRRLPMHVTPVARAMIEAVTEALPRPARASLRLVMHPHLGDRVLDALGARARLFDVVLHNTAAATIVRGGHAYNVIPDEASVDLDCRLLPGQTEDDIVRELRALAGTEVEFKVLRYHPGPPAADMTLYGTLADILRQADPNARPIPLLLPGVTDGRFFAKLGIQTYGFLPMRLPPELPFMDVIHAADERIPVEAVEYGTRAIQRLLDRLAEAAR